MDREKWTRLRTEMHKLGIYEKDLIEKFILGSGSGGQKLQKTSSCVYLRHPATGIEVKCQKARLQEANRYHARQLLCLKVERLRQKEAVEKKRLSEKKRREHRRRPKHIKEKMLEEKRFRSETKKLRRKPDA